MFPPLRHIAPRLSGVNRAAAQNFLIARGGLLVCVFFALAGLAAAGDYGMGEDELTQRRIVLGNLDYILGRDTDFVFTERYYGVAFELPLLLAERALGLEDYHYAHRLRITLTHLFFIVGGFFCYLLAYRLFNSRLIALFALLFYLLHPRIYGHSFFNAKDLPFLSMFVLALYLLERAFRKDTLGAFLLLGIAVGLLTNLRIMGIMLLAAVLAMRGLDWFYAAGGSERKQIMRTGGLFLLAAGLTWYAVTPYAWANPLYQLANSLKATVHSPGAWLQLFQGEWFLTNQLPPHYNAVWFGITAPPLLLLLGGLGIALVLAPGRARPGAVFRNGRRRFLLLLLACFLLPPLAALLLSANQHNDWRHFYFLYAPFCLLAAGGLGWLTTAPARRRGPAGVYGLTGLGLGLVLLQIAQLHPLPHLYFNFLVDRTTPEQLRTQYHFDYAQLAQWDALQRLAARHPGETLVVRVSSAGDQERLFPLLAPADRARLRPAAAGDNADYELIYPLDLSRPDLAFNTAYRRIYNNTFVLLRPLAAARMTPAAVAAYREIYRQAVAGEPILRADYNVYRRGQRLTFVQENCPPESRDAWFGVNPFPPDPQARPPETEFYTAHSRSNHRVRLGDICLAVIQLPDYIRGDITLEQRHLDDFRPADDALGSELYSLDPPGGRERLDRLAAGPAPARPAAFAVFLEPAGAGRYRLFYAKANCAPAEYETRVFLHITPENLADLPFYLWNNGFDNREFFLPPYGARFGGECLAALPLPEYPIAALLTGQAGIWETNLYPPANPDTLRMAYAALAGSPPAAQGDFALYLRDNRLIYLRESCAAADTAAGFFLHIIPEDAADLPGERQAAGFANRDFAFARYGGAFDGKCLATVPLPDYPIKALRTGQFQTDQGELWAAELAVEW